MFEALNSASQQNKYEITWVELAPVQFQGVIDKWFAQLGKSRMASGPNSSQRKALAEEFLRLLHVQKQVLVSTAPAATQGIAVSRCDVNIRWFQQAYQQKFKVALAPPPPQESALKQLLEQQGMLRSKLGTLDAKHQLINHWLHGLQQFPEHRDDSSLTFQYMGNAPSEKVRLFLQVLCSDAEKMVSLKDPGHFKASYGTQAGLHTAGDNGKLTKVVWTNDAFKKAIQAEIGAGYGVSANGSCELEFKGLKAKLEGEAWAGMRAKAQGKVEYTVGSGGTIQGSVEAEIGVKLKGTAALDCADIFLCEASAEAFAGAMAKAEVEVTARVDGVSVKVGAEVFAGAKLTGEAKMTFKLQGYEILSTKATGALTAGIGAKFAMEFECSAFGGAKFKLEAGTTLGVGAEAGTEIVVKPDNIKRALYSLYFTTHLTLLGENKKKYAWKTYFRELEDNKILFERARGIIEDHMKVVIMERQRLFSEQRAWQQLEGLSALRHSGGM